MELIQQGHYWQYAEVDTANDYPNTILGFSLIKWFFIILSISISIFCLTKGLSEHLIGCILSGLGLYVGFFISFIVFIFEKFYNTDFSKKGKSDIQIAGLIIQKNYIKQFTSLASYSVLISLVCIILLALGLIYEPLQFEINWNVYTNTLTSKEFILLFKYSLLVIYRSVIIYFLLDLILLTLYVITSMHSYMQSIYRQTSLKDLK